MKSRVSTRIALLVAALVAAPADAQFADWKHSGSLWILTTPEGANLPASADLADFPLLVRLHRDWFDFAGSSPTGADLRFATREGKSLPYDIEEWDANGGRASIWVRVPRIRGNARQELRLYWGNPNAKAESSSRAVFDGSNGYLSVWHMNGTATDAVGTLTGKDTGTTATRGIVGGARHFAGKRGIEGGQKILDYPTGSAPHSTEAWFRAEKANVTIVGWGNEGGGRGSKVRMQLRSPPHIHIDSDFSDVDAPRRVPFAEWVHVVHTSNGPDGRIYLDGKLAGEATPTLNIERPARFWIGGWYDNHDFVGDIDEVRVSKVARSADWIRFQYENQKPMQTAVGPVVREGDAFSVSDAKRIVDEGATATFTAKADGAQKLYWILERNGVESVAAVDRSGYDFEAGRVVGDRSATLRVRAVYPDGIREKTIAIVVRESIAEPEFVLEAPATWDGRKTIEIAPKFAGPVAVRAEGAREMKYTWSVDGIATIRETAPGKLVLTRAQNSGTMVVTLTASNGGEGITRTATISVREPASDPWVRRTPAKDEMPQDRQFYARDDRNEATLHCNGTLAEPADSAFLKLYADGKLVGTERQKPEAGKVYALTAKLKPGLIRYRVEFGSGVGTAEKILHTATDIVCGDAYLIDGQSNAEATAFDQKDPEFTSEWIRSFGSPTGDPKGARLSLWANAVCRDRRGGKAQVGAWGLELAKRLVENHKVPICLINGAVGGSRIDQHQRSAIDPVDVETIYGRLLWRVRAAKLTHGIRGILWHQGENDQGADGPSGGFGWETYRELFTEMAAGWKRDYPNLQHTYAFQIWPKACSMGTNGSDNVLREVQRTLPRYFSKLSVMSTLGIDPPGGCHFPIEGYTALARLVAPLVERDNYGVRATKSVTAPNLIAATWTGDKKDRVSLEFDQPVVWNRELAGQFYLDGAKGKVVSGSVEGNRLQLQLDGASTATRIAYLDSREWKQSTLLRSIEGIAALTFCDVPIGTK